MFESYPSHFIPVVVVVVRVRSFLLCDLLYIHIYLSTSVIYLCSSCSNEKLEQSERHTPLICRWKAKSVLLFCFFSFLPSIRSLVGKVMNSIYSTWSKNLAWATTSTISLVSRKLPKPTRSRRHTGRSKTFVASIGSWVIDLPGNFHWSGIRINPMTPMLARSFVSSWQFTRSWKTSNAVLDTIVFWSKVCRNGINRCSISDVRRNCASGKSSPFSRWFSPWDIISSCGRCTSNPV